MLTFDRISVEYGPGNRPLRDLSIDIPAGSTAVMGPSGSGKSTLLRVLAGVQAPDSGAVKIDSQPVAVASWRSAGDPRVALIHQDYRLVPFLTVEENLLLAAELRAVPARRRDCDQIFEQLDLDSGLRERLPATLSGGQQQRVAIARALLCRVEVLLADEPTGALDVQNTELISGLLAEIGRRDGVSVVVATHDPVVASALDRTYVLRDGALCVQ